MQKQTSEFFPAISRLDGEGSVPYSAWSGVVRITDGRFTGSGVLSSSGLHIISAAHVADSLHLPDTRVYFPSGVNSPVQDFMPYPQAQIDDQGIWHDLVLITLEQSAPYSAERYELYSDRDEIGQTAAVVGYGQGQYPDGTSMNDSRPVLREGLNTVDTTASEFSSRGWEGSLDDQLLFDFDDGTSENDTIGNFLDDPHLGVGELEAMITSGDSGGGLFLPQDDNWLLAGIHSYVSGYEPWGTPGDIGASTRISSYTDWILTQTGQEQEIEASPGDPPSVPMQVEEGQGVYFLVEIPGGASEYSTVEFFTRDGTAKAGLDYIPTSGQVIFGQGDSWAKVWVQTLADSLVEGEEDFEIVLTNPTGAAFPGGMEELSASRNIVDEVSLTGVTDLSMEIFG